MTKSLEEVIRNLYINYVYTDIPHGLSDKDIGILTKGIKAYIKSVRPACSSKLKLNAQEKFIWLTAQQ